MSRNNAVFLDEKGFKVWYQLGDKRSSNDKIYECDDMYDALEMARYLVVKYDFPEYGIQIIPDKYTENIFEKK